jgi:Mg2+-importing ATPase
VVVKGASEQVLAGCADVAEVARRTLDALFADGRRVVAVAVKEAPGLTTVTAADETGLTLTGFLTFADNPKAAARQSLARLGALEIEVKVATGDNPRVAEKVCAELGLVSKGTVTGSGMDRLSEREFDDMVETTTIFARSTPSRRHD